jgi:hypothetical protein
MTETYSALPKYDELPHGLYVQGLHDDYEGFRIILEEKDGGTGAVYAVRFNDQVAYRNMDEGCRLRTLLKLPERRMLLRVENSQWIDWFVEESSGVFDDSKLIHWAVVTPNDWIDIISFDHPEVKCLTS